MKKIKRILALLLVIFLIAMVFVTLYCAVTGSPYFMASLFVMLGLPLLIYAYMFIYRIVKDKDEKEKNEFNNLASKDEPFNLTMLTVDTHFTDGYVCELCQNQYDEQYSNVIACSSRQVSEFLDWIKQQDFYDNTTVVISGDHLTMDSDYIERQNATDFNRRTYFTIVNGAAVNEKPCVEREYTTLDLYPTTLAALGVQIEGNRLGLGTNLYSGEDTLIEKYGLDYINVELLKDSQLYRKKLLYGKN